MDQQTKMMKQMMDLQRSSFDGMLNNMIMFWEHTERTVNAFLDQASWLPEEGKKAVREWTDANRKGCEGFKCSMNDSFSRMESFFMGGEKMPHA